MSACRLNKTITRDGGYIVGMDFNRQVAFFVLGVGCSLVVMCLRLRLSVSDLVAVACFFYSCPLGGSPPSASEL